MKWFATTSAIIIVLAIGLGLYTSGSPATARKERADNSREMHLQDLYYDINAYYQVNNTLPASLEDMEKERTYAIPRDPVTGLAYGYTPKDSTSFELCATFFLASKEPYNRYYYPQDQYYPNFVEHEAGDVCFTAKIQEMQK